MCYELATNQLLAENFECGPRTKSAGAVKEQTIEIQEELNLLIPQLSQDTVVFYPSWIEYFTNVIIRL